MKKYLYIAAAATMLLTACSSDQELANIEQATAGNNVIGFNIVANSSSNGTRATLVTNANLKTAAPDFDVWCFDGTNPYMSQTKIAYSNNKWDYTKEGDKRYWTNTELNFYAINPSSTVTPTMSSTSQSFKYSVIDEYGSANTDKKVNKDVMYASALKQKYNATNGTTNKINYVTMAFKHALAALVFKAKYDNTATSGLGSDAIVNIKSITLKTMLPDGEFKFGDTPTITASGTAIDVTVPLTAPLSVQSAGTDITTKTNNPIIVIPQTTTYDSTNKTGTYLSIKCQIKANGSYIKGSEGTADGNYDEVIVPFAQTLDMGKLYTITLNFTANDDDLIMFDATAEDWTEINTTDIDVK